jgi:uncharacterized protein YeaO (DUF488 family)
MLKNKRVYEAVDESDGVRFFVERLWPRGVNKDKLLAQAWLKDISPSADLRRWYSHDQKKWVEFQQRYQAELANNAAGLKTIQDAMTKGSVTLLYSAQDTEHNSALVLRSFLEDFQKS